MWNSINRKKQTTKWDIGEIEASYQTKMSWSKKIFIAYSLYNVKSTEYGAVGYKTYINIIRTTCKSWVGIKDFT